MLYYVPPSRGPLFQLCVRKPFLKNSNQQLSPQLYFRSFAHTGPVITRIEKCLTIGPLPRALSFNFKQGKFCKAPTSSSHQNFIVGCSQQPHSDLEA